jgi:hypothetical protein
MWKPSAFSRNADRMCLAILPKSVQHTLDGTATQFRHRFEQLLHRASAPAVFFQEGESFLISRITWALSPGGNSRFSSVFPCQNLLAATRTVEEALRRQFRSAWLLSALPRW